MHLELCGPVSGFGTERRRTDSNPGRVRFMVGSSDAFSSPPYAVRRWQHIVATGHASAMQLYIDGKFVGRATDTSKLPDGLQVLMGQLYPVQFVPERRGDIAAVCGRAR